MEKRPHRQDRRVGDSTPTPAAEQPAPAIDPTLYAREDLRRILAALDIGGLYRTLKDEAGVAARQLWRPTRYDPYGDLDRPTASLALRRGRLDLAESLAQELQARRGSDYAELSRQARQVVATRA